MSRTISELEALKLFDFPVLELVARERVPYRVDRQWGVFDELSLRAIDDLWYSESSTGRGIIAFSNQISLTEGLDSVSIPMAVALERVFFHIQEIDSLCINPRAEPAGLSELQVGVLSGVGLTDDPEFVLSRAEIAAVIGMLAAGKKKVKNPVEKATTRFREGALFEAYFIARKSREQGIGDQDAAWFTELMSLSFLGLPEESLRAYEEYPARGSSTPRALLLSARFRLLLKQFNEARTILHTLTFNDEVGALAACELARSYNMTGDFNRAIDAATLAISKNGSYAESYLLRGVAHRGLAYPSGDEEGLREALKNFEVVATRSGFSAAEASFHAGTVFGRFGALDSAENSLRQSLFQRDRFSARDALVRVLVAAGKMASAEEELECLSKLAPASSQKLGEEVLAHAPRRSEPVSAGQAGHMADLWGSDFNLARAAASHILSLWRIPICGSIEDFILLDDFINRFAPAGEFPATGEWAAVGKAEVETVTRAIALHLGDIIVKNGAGSWADVNPDHRVLQLGKAGTRVPIEAFVRERILLGASGDNFSSLESLISEAREGKELFVKPELPQWWSEASVEERAEFLARAAAGKKRLTEMGAELSGKLGDLEEIDRVIEAYFEPGGVVKDGMEPTVGESVEQFIVETALYLGSLVMQAVSVNWFTHEQPEGISVYHPGLGRIFPISKLQRRVYLSSAADFSVRLSSFAFGVAAVAVQEGIKANRYGDVDQVCDALIGMIPSMKEFPESELQGVAQSLLGSRG